MEQLMTQGLSRRGVWKGKREREVGERGFTERSLGRVRMEGALA